VGTALWINANMDPLLTEIGKQLLDNSPVGSLDPSELVPKIIDLLKTEACDQNTVEQARDLAYVMTSLGSVLNLSTSTRNGVDESTLDSRVFEKACRPCVAELIRWIVTAETRYHLNPLEERIRLFESFYSEPQALTGFELNRWAYILLRLELYHAATPIAELAYRSSDRIDYFPQEIREAWPQMNIEYGRCCCEDTLGFALCYEGDWDRAKTFLDSAGHALPVGSKDWSEVQYHRCHAAFWSDDQHTLRSVLDLLEHSGQSMWAKRALDCFGIKSAHARKAPPSTYRYDLVISFAGEDQSVADALVNELDGSGLSIFYDDFERACLWGSNLYEYLTDVYKTQGKYCLVLISKHYLRKRWTRLEWRAIQARCFEENAAYLLPVRIDDTELPGLLPTVGHLSLQSHRIAEIASLVCQKLRM